ncbi:MAG: alcohol dehydrogenase catalytic domain-containing protein [Acidimicrobiaceae bacterium]|nr:alcohol dehydrogenase catalytic domain-containing protein [Acidimicrobiaceae bacterium]
MTATPTTMAAAVYRRQGELELADVPVPVLGPGDALVEVAYCGLCGTDLHMVLDGWGEPGSVLGHEWSGRVAAAGADARIDVGTPVIGRGWVECGRCRHCRAGQPGLCTQRPLAGVDDHHSGAFARYLAVDYRNLTAVPDGIGLREAAYAEPLAVAMHAVTKGAFEPGGRAMVFGCGPIGAAVVAVLIARDADVTVVEPQPRRQDLARRLGATVRPADDLEAPGHPGQVPTDAVGWVFETSGARQAAQAGLTQLAGGGTMVIVGIGMDYPRLDTSRMILNELVVTGAYEYDPGGLAAALELIASGVLPMDVLLEPDPVGLDGILETMGRLRSGEVAGKVLVQP